jgi:hypothetical protein
VIPAGQTSKDFIFNVLSDTKLEPNESFVVHIEDVVGVQVNNHVATATLLNDDIANGISVDDVSIAEGGSLTFTVRLSAPSAGPVQFDAWTSPGTAAPGVDYLATQAQGLVIPAGSLSATFNVPTVQDSLVEDNESLVVNLANVTGATVSDGQGLGRILNDDLPGLSISDASLVEGDSGVTMMRFEIRLSSPAPTATSFWVTVEPGTADYPDYFIYPSTGLKIDAGRTSAVLEVYVLGDTTPEPDEIFTADLVGVTGATVLDGHAVGTILNDDAAPLVHKPQKGRVLKIKAARTRTGSF